SFPHSNWMARTRVVSRDRAMTGWGFLASDVVSIRVHLQRGDERFLWNLDFAELSHPFLALFLLVEELAFSGDVTAIAFRGHVLAQRTDRFARDDLAADRRLDRYLEKVPRNQVLELLAHRAAACLGSLAIDDDRKRVDRIAIDEDRHLDEVALFIAFDVIV